MADTPIVVKGGTALLLCYGLDRFSEDLDFDCPRKINLENRVKTALMAKVANPKMKLLKAGENVTRYHLTGQTPQGEMSIKIETSHRDEIRPDDVATINGVRAYKLPVLCRYLPCQAGSWTGKERVAYTSLSRQNELSAR